MPPVTYKRAVVDFEVSTPVAPTPRLLNHHAQRRRCSDGQRWFARRAVLIIAAYLIGMTTALVPKINSASWSDLAASKEKVCGDAAHRDACVRRLKSDETDALVTEASPVYLADTKESPKVYRDLLALTVDSANVKSMPRRDWLATVLLGAADDAEAGAVLLIDAQCATDVSCGGRRYCACTNVPHCRDWAAPRDVRSPFGSEYPGGLYAYGLPFRHQSFSQACLVLEFRPAGMRYHWLGAAPFVRDRDGKGAAMKTDEEAALGGRFPVRYM